MKKNIWIINQYASHLETRHLELSKVFARNGCNVTVITSSFHHGKREYIYPEELRCVERAENVNYIYLKVKPEYKSNGVKRVLSWFGFCTLFLRKLRQIEKIAGKPDYVIASSAPPTVWELGLHCAKKYGAKYIAEFRDIWPLSLVEVQGLSPRHPAVIFFGILEKRAYRKSDAIVATMPYAWRHVCEVAEVPREKVFWLPNGINTGEADKWLESSNSLPAELEEFLSKHWCCIYVGSIVKSECVDFLVEAIGKIKNEGVYLAVVGEGHEKENIQQLIYDNGYENIKMFPHLERELIPKALSKAKCCVAACKDSGIGRYGLSMYKLCDYLYSGKPTIFAYDLQSVVTDAGHFAIPFGDEERFAQTVREIKSAEEANLIMLANNAQELICEQYDFEKIGKKYLDTIFSC